MKKRILTTALILFILGGNSSCSTHKHTHVKSIGKVPPGQMKKMTGEKSAKKYAPGQQKKKQ